jgi:hypothetical protein
MNKTEKLDLVLRTMTPPGDWKEAQQAMTSALNKRRKTLSNNLYLEIRGKNWHTVDYPLKKHGFAEIVHTKYDSGCYVMEGVDGFAFYELDSPIILNNLKINGETAMIDDPLHWIGMQRLAEHCKGRVIIAGLGLGLILHHLVKNKDVDEILVVEVNQFVIDLIEPLLPNDDRVRIVCEDIRAFELSELAQYDTIVFDVWVKGEKGMRIDFPSTGEIMARAEALRTIYKKNVMVWGLRNELNPAVKMTPQIENILKTVTKVK